jgi:putative spermidine/putrescine transport system ATP-binding protein
MDEPLGALDKRLREQMQIEIKHIHDRIGMTVVYVTHDQGEALTMSSPFSIVAESSRLARLRISMNAPKPPSWPILWETTTT